MSEPRDIDGVLVQWGDRLFYPGNRIVKSKPQPKLSALTARLRAAAIRERIEATVVRRAPQVTVKVTGGGRGMKAIAAHFRYISKNGRLEIEDDQGNVSRGKDAVRELAQDWRFGGSLIPDESPRREAFNVILSMPRGTDPAMLHRAARDFAKSEFADHKYVMVLHDHQANPHVHLSVRAESSTASASIHARPTSIAGGKPSPKAQGLGHRCRGDPAGKPGGRPELPEPLAQEGGGGGQGTKAPARAQGRSSATASRREAGAAWTHIAAALRSSSDPWDRTRAAAIEQWMTRRPVARELEKSPPIRSVNVERTR